jgi:alpha-tubulin suppressor-like RCC1 family protein
LAGRSIMFGDALPTALLICALASTVIALAAPHAAFAAQGSVMRWGSFGDPPGAHVPTTVDGLTNVTAIAASNGSAYSLESNGSVWAWGNNGRGELGDDSEQASPNKAVQVQLPTGVRATAIGEAEFVGFAIDSAGHAWAWGNAGATACLGPGQFTTPVQVPGISEAIAVDGGGHHTIWLLSDGTVEACGNNEQGQLGVSGISVSGTPIHVPGVSDVVEISAAERTSCARTASGAVYDWGANSEGQIGDGETSEGVFAPYHVPLPGPASEVSCGGNVPTDDYTLALVDGQVYGWGADGNSQIGDLSTADKPSPVATGLTFSQVVASGGTSYGLTASGALYSWGSPFEGSLGDGKTKGQPVPAFVNEGVVAISATAHDADEMR